MKSILNFSLLVLVVSFVFTSCKKDPEEPTIVKGCTDSTADGFNPNATEDDNSCTYQKRYLGEYTGDIKCPTVFAAVFSMADLSIIETIDKKTVNIIIQTTIGPIPVVGNVTKSELNVDALIPDLSIKPSDILAGASETPIKADAEIKSLLTLSEDGKILTGVLNLKLTTKEATSIGAVPIPAGTSLGDACPFTGTKK
jgi:hypothetical protein